MTGMFQEASAAPAMATTRWGWSGLALAIINNEMGHEARCELGRGIVRGREVSPVERHYGWMAMCRAEAARQREAVGQVHTAAEVKDAAEELDAYYQPQAACVPGLRPVGVRP